MPKILSKRRSTLRSQTSETKSTATIQFQTGNVEALVSIPDETTDPVSTSIKTSMKRCLKLTLVFLLFGILCLPGNLSVLYFSLTDVSVNRLTAPKQMANDSQLECQESKEDWRHIVAWSQYLIQGISVMIISIFGLLANLLSIIVLYHCKSNRNFHRLLIGLAFVDSLLVIDLAIGTSLFGVFMKKEPRWYIWAYPYIVHPAKGIIRTSAIYMVVAVTAERYR